MANNVTFIIGNGLDLSLKLNTSYKDFYKHVKKNALHPNNTIYKAIAKAEPEDWADFEFGLGRHTNEIEKVTEKGRAQWSKTLNNELDEIKKDLKLYIKEQNLRADEQIQNIKFENQSFYLGLESGQVSILERELNNGQSTSVRFITLNYTDVLEKLFPTPRTHHAASGFYFPDHVHHVHGSIHSKISLGVNDESQLSSYIDEKEKNFLIKPELIRQMYDGRLETLSTYIRVSDIIVLFGTSLGVTDKYIWNQVTDWLVGNQNRLLIIHHFERGLDVSDLTERESLQLNDRVKNKLLDYSGLDDDQNDRVRSRIYVLPNTSELFTLQ